MEYVSPGVKQLCGYEPRDLLSGKLDWGSIVHPHDIEAVEAEIAVAVAERRPFEFIYRIEDASGRTKWVHEKGQAAQVGAEGGLVLIGFIMHVTIDDLAAAPNPRAVIFDKSALRRSVEMELLYKSGLAGMGTMAATLAHELNQPLTAISFYAAALKKSLSAQAEDSAADLVKSIQLSATHAGNIIRRLRQFVLTGTPEKERFTASEVIEEAVQLARLGCARVAIYRDLDDITIEGADRVQIQQVLVNLLRNACEAVSNLPKPEVRISAATIVDNGQPRIHVSVTDNGAGIPESLRATIFESGVSTKQTGMGIGLAISRTIVEAHAGRIWADDSSTGASIRFEIPIKRR